jgi:hypothetical protein
MTASLEGASTNASVIQLKVERYKFVLSEMGRLNENTHKNTKYLLTIYPALSGAIIALRYTSFGQSVPSGSGPVLAFGVLQLLTMVSAFGVVSVVSDLASWLDYRREEVALITSMGGDFRQAPKLQNFWRWYETYLVLFIFIYTGFTWSIYLSSK